MAKIEVKVPDIGDFKDVPIIEILVKPGDAVKAEQSAGDARIRQGDDGRARAGAGVVGEIIAKVGDKVSMGTPLLTLEAEGAAAPAAGAPTAAAAAPAPAPASPPARAAAPAELEQPAKCRPARQRFRSGGRAQSRWWPISPASIAGPAGRGVSRGNSAST